MTRCNKRPPWLANLMTTPKETQTEHPVTVDKATQVAGSVVNMGINKETQTDSHQDYGPMPKDGAKTIPKYNRWSTK